EPEGRGTTRRAREAGDGAWSEHADLKIFLRVLADVLGQLANVRGHPVQALRRRVQAVVERRVLRQLAERPLAPVDAAERRLERPRGASGRPRDLLQPLRERVEALHGPLQLRPRRRLLEAGRGALEAGRQVGELAALLFDRG